MFRQVGLVSVIVNIIADIKSEVFFGTTTFTEDKAGRFKKFYIE